jgi:uncharacterized protein with NRDE domain
MHYIGNRQSPSLLTLKNGRVYGISNGFFEGSPLHAASTENKRTTDEASLIGSAEKISVNDDEARPDWPKVKAGKAIFNEAITSSHTVEELESSLIKLLQNEDEYPDELIPVNLDFALEKALCPICIDVSRTKRMGKHYGTRAHSVITVKDGVCRYLEVERYNELNERVDLRRVEEFSVKH